MYITLGRRGYLALPMIIRTLDTQALLPTMGNSVWGEEKRPRFGNTYSKLQYAHS